MEDGDPACLQPGDQCLEEAEHGLGMATCLFVVVPRYPSDINLTCLIQLACFSATTAYSH